MLPEFMGVDSLAAVMGIIPHTSAFYCSTETLNFVVHVPEPTFNARVLYQGQIE